MSLKGFISIENTFLTFRINVRNQSYSKAFQYMIAHLLTEHIKDGTKTYRVDIQIGSFIFSIGNAELTPARISPVILALLYFVTCIMSSSSTFTHKDKL